MRTAGRRAAREQRLEAAFLQLLFVVSQHLERRSFRWRHVQDPRHLAFDLLILLRYRRARRICDLDLAQRNYQLVEFPEVVADGHRPGISRNGGMVFAPGEVGILRDGSRLPDVQQQKRRPGVRDVLLVDVAPAVSLRRVAT